MPGYRGHLAGGLAAAVICTVAVGVMPYQQLAQYAHLLQGWQILTGVFIVAMLFALFPDVDIKSEGQKLFYWAAFLVDAFLIWYGFVHVAAYLGLLAMLPLLSKHRGWTHSPLAAFIVPAPMLIIPYLYDDHALALGVIFYAASVVGYLSHILLDGQLLVRLRRLL